MPDNNSDKMWDEYDWERFLQQQEQRTEKYMELLEKFMNHPERDEIIAREMGWDLLLNESDPEWEEEVDATFEREISEIESQGSDEEIPRDTIFAFERHPLYRQAIAFATELDEIFDATSERTQEHPATISLMSQTTLASAKLAAALNDGGIDELGMSIAYLKRALHAITGGLTAVRQLIEGEHIERATSERIFHRLFSIREGIVDTMGHYRAEFRKRHGE